MTEIETLCAAVEAFERGDEKRARAFFRRGAFLGNKQVRSLGGLTKGEVARVRGKYIVKSPHGSFILCGQRVVSKRLPVLPLVELRKMLVGLGFYLEPGKDRRVGTKVQRRAVRRG